MSCGSTVTAKTVNPVGGASVFDGALEREPLRKRRCSEEVSGDGHVDDGVRTVATRSSRARG
jgi:hypothetical protein